jgi:type IV pilus assembly protein PilW
VTSGPRAGRQRGVTLIELMIGLVLGLLLLAGLYQIYLASLRSYSMASALSMRQEAVRYVSRLLAEDVRMAGYRGCLPDGGNILNTVNPDPAGGGRTNFTHPDFAFRFERYIEGFDADGAGWDPALPAVISGVRSGTDVLTLRAAFYPELYVIQDPPGQSPSASLRTNPSNPPVLAAGDIALVTDCAGATVFQVTNVQTASPTLTTIVHNAGQGAGLPTPGNWQQSLGQVYNVGSQVMRIATVSYFIRDSASGSGPALWRRIEGDATPEREIAEGIENLQVLYGVDMDGDDNPDIYDNAATVAAAGRWRSVVAVRVALLVSGVRDRAGEADAVTTYTLLDAPAVGPFPDGRLRRVVTLTLALRNRLP